MLKADLAIRPETASPMSTTPDPSAAAESDLAAGVWHHDPRRSSVEFHVRHFYGLMTVNGHFDDYKGTLALASDPAVQLTIDADSLDTGHALVPSPSR